MRIDASASSGLGDGSAASCPVVSNTTEPTVPRDAISAAIRIQSIVELRSTNQKKRYAAYATCNPARTATPLADSRPAR